MLSDPKSTVRRLLPRGIRPHHILSGPLRGQRIVTSWHDYPAAIAGYTERPLLGWLAANVRSGETWLDVGAHYGYTALALCRLVGPSGRVFAFEPMLATAGYLAQTRAHNDLSQLTVLPLALAATEKMEVHRLPIVRGMVDSTITGAGWHEPLLVASLDQLWPQGGGDRSRIDGIKIDVQGMELETLRGMARLLREQRPKLVVELHEGVDRVVLLDLIAGLGYMRQAIPIEPVAGEAEPRYLDNRSYAFRPIQGLAEESR